MEQKYAAALMHLVENGTNPSDAVAAIAKALEARGRTGLLSRVGRAFERLAEKRAARERTVVAVAREADAAHARAVSGAPDAQIRVDDTLIGGWRLEKGDTLVDASYKTHLLNIYHRATRA